MSQQPLQPNQYKAKRCSMDTNQHIDMNQVIQDEITDPKNSLEHRAICYGDPDDLKQLSSKGSMQLTISPNKEVPSGPRQVESLLRFVVSKEVERAMEDTVADNIVYNQLGEHRILGKMKNKKKNRMPAGY